jgi:hypothetical protein
MLQDSGEGGLGRIEPERMEQRHRPIELLLRRNLARNGKVHFTKLFRFSGTWCVVFVRKRDRRGNTCQKQGRKDKLRVSHL